MGRGAEAKVKQAKDHDSRKESEEAPDATPKDHDQRRRPVETAVGEASAIDCAVKLLSRRNALTKQSLVRDALEVALREGRYELARMSQWHSAIHDEWLHS